MSDPGSQGVGASDAGIPVISNVSFDLHSKHERGRLFFLAKPIKCNVLVDRFLDQGEKSNAVRTVQQTNQQGREDRLTGAAVEVGFCRSVVFTAALSSDAASASLAGLDRQLMKCHDKHVACAALPSMRNSQSRSVVRSSQRFLIGHESSLMQQGRERGDGDKIEQEPLRALHFRAI